MAVAKEYIINSGEDLLQCPYESAHMIFAKRMQYHLRACRKNHPSAGSVFKKCPFNASHEVPQVELRYHMAVCPNKTQVVGKITQERYNQGDEQTGCLETPGYRPLGIPGDSWDDRTPTIARIGAPEEDPRRSSSRERDTESYKPRMTIPPGELKGLSNEQKRERYLQLLQQEQKDKVGSKEPERNGEMRQLRAPSQAMQPTYERAKQEQPDTLYQFMHSYDTGGRGRGAGGINNGDAPAPPPGGHHPPQNRTQAPPLAGCREAYFANGAGTTNSMGLNAAGRGVETVGGMGERMRMTAIGRGRGGGEAGGMMMMNQARDSSYAGSRQACVGDSSSNSGSEAYGIGRGQPQHPSFSLAAQGSFASASGGGVPYYEPASQPMAVGVSPSQFTGRGRGIVNAVPTSDLAATAPGGYMSERQQQYSSLAFQHQQQESYQYQDSSTEDDGESFQDALSWVGGGYQAPGTGATGGAEPVGGAGAWPPPPQAPPSSSSSMSSVTSMVPNAAVGSWADAVDEEFPLHLSTTASSSQSQSEGDYQDGSQRGEGDSVLDMGKQLRKLEKKLRSIHLLEDRVAKGEQLESEQVVKLQSKVSVMSKIETLKSKMTADN